MIDASIQGRLDSWLLSDDSPEDAMMLSDLDGFLHGIACSPKTLRPARWLPIALGATPNTVPAWVQDALQRWLRAIKQNLQATPPVVEPVFWQAPAGHVIAMDWCEGFMDAIKLCPKEWLQLQDSPTNSHLMTPILVHILDDDFNSVLGIPEEKLDEAMQAAAAKIPQSIIEIYAFWRATGPTKTVTRLSDYQH